LQDGEVLHVPLYLMDGRSNPDLDSLQRDVASHYARVTDGAGDGGLGLHRPGFRISNTVTRDRSIYDAYDAAAEIAYKNAGAVESEVRGQREGDSCTVKSDQGRDGSAESKLNDTMRDEREAAYQEYLNRIQNAWRGGR
jgi:hypothetical protein